MKVEPHPIKIVRILGRLNIGGPAVHAVLLTEGLQDQKTRSILVTGMVGKSEGNMVYFARQHGVNPLIIPELGREISWRDDLVALWKLCRIMIRERPDVVHTHTAKAGTLGRLAALWARVPVRIHTFHGHVFHGYFSPFKTQLFILIERLLAFFTTRIVAISNAQLVELSSRYRIAARRKFKVVPIGLDLAPLLQIQREPGKRNSGFDDQEIALGWVGRLVPIKNPQLAIQAFERLVRSGGPGRQVRLIIAGDGELKSELQEQASAGGFGDLIHFVGWKQNLSDLYSSLHLVLVTSRNEGTPVVLIEAMAAGLPFVATRVGGILDLMVGPEQVIRGGPGHSQFSLYANGALVESGDVKGFEAALKHLLRDREQMKRMGVEGRKFARERFSKERLVRDTRALYDACLASDGSFAHKQNGMQETIHPAKR